MSRSKIYLRNLTSNWIGFGLNLIIMFAMSPFVIHRLGDVNYGVWTIMMTMTGYLGLVEIGTRGGLGRFINYYLGKNDIPKVNGTINTAMVIFFVVGLAVILVCATLIVAMPSIFPKIPVELLPTARIVLALIGLNVWISFFTAAFRQILVAHERFDLRNISDVVVLLARTGLTIWALLSGYELVALGLIQTVTSFFGLIISIFMALKIFPDLVLSFSFASMERFRELFSFSIWAFVADLSYRLLYSADSILIGILLGPKWVTYYTVGGMLLYRGREFIGQASSIFAPKMMQDCATNNLKNLRRSFVYGSNLTMVICILVFVGMISFGLEFIVLWMGNEFLISYDILFILIVSSFFAVAFQVGGPIYSGMNRVKLAAILLLAQGLLNLGLSICFVSVLGFGIEGVAWGSFYPRIFFGVLSGFIVMQWIKLEKFQYFKKTVFRWLLVGLGFYLICSLLDEAIPSGSWSFFAIKVVVATSFYFPLAWFIALDAGQREYFISHVKIKKFKNKNRLAR